MKNLFAPVAKTIPLNSLVLAVGPSGSGKSTLLRERFPEYEIIESDRIRYELTGDADRQDVHVAVFAEQHRRALAKLEIGERAVIDATHLRAKERQAAARIGYDIGVPVYYLVIDRPLKDKLATQGHRRGVLKKGVPLVEVHHQTFQQNEREILTGDISSLGPLATVIDTRKEEFVVVAKPKWDEFVDDVRSRGYAGLAVVPDVHNTADKFQSAIDWAGGRNLFLVLLGDVVDYGPQPLECIEMAYREVTRGHAVMILGNHERKAMRYYGEKAEAVRAGLSFDEYEPEVILSAANRATIDAIDALEPALRQKMITRLMALCSMSRLHFHAANLTFVHGAAHESIFGMHSHRLEKTARDWAFFGQAQGFKEADENGDRFPNRMYDWVEKVPASRIVIVGHDIRDREKPLVVANGRGGRAVFADTGCGKGGPLTVIEIPFGGNDLLNLGETAQF